MNRRNVDAWRPLPREDIGPGRFRDDGAPGFFDENGREWSCGGLARQRSIVIGHVEDVVLPVIKRRNVAHSLREVGRL